MILLGSIGASGVCNGTPSPVGTSSPNGCADSNDTDRRPSSPSTTPKRGLPSTLSRAIRTRTTLPSNRIVQGTGRRVPTGLPNCRSGHEDGMRLDDWFLDPDERGNPATLIRSWTTGNLVRPLVHGAEY